jgi:hypothetical protein
MKATTFLLTDSVQRSILWRVFCSILLLLTCYLLVQQAQAVTPAPDGVYTGWNTAEGQDALFSDTTGAFNTAIGGDALYADTTGSSNTAVGAFSLTANSSGFQNAAVGQGALRYNTTGYNNMASGFQALYFNTTGTANTASGAKALFKNTIGFDNTASGVNALYGNTTGSNNTATGAAALYSNTTGSGNTANGLSALFSNTTGSNNTADGYLSLLNKPVTFRYKDDLDPKRITRFGLVAEEVQKVNADLVARDEQGKPYTVRYEAVNAMLLNEFLKEHRTVQDLKAVVAQQQKQIEALTAGLQKVSAEVEMSKPLLQTIANGQ